MMSTYHPDSWVPVVIESKEHGKVYKILASWYGGYVNPDSWKLSSGIESISTDENGMMTMPQSSGSVYVVPPRTHMSLLMDTILSSFKLDGEECGFTIDVIEVSELLDAFKQ